MTPRLLPLAALLVLALSACDTFERRSQEKAAVFAALTPEQRDKLAHGSIEIGHTPDMVYIALGTPDEKRETTTAQGRETTWTYYSYHRDYEGQARTGYHRILVFDPATKRYTVFLDPIYTDVYSDRFEEFITVLFRDDRVVQIEQPKR